MSAPLPKPGNFGNIQRETVERMVASGYHPHSAAILSGLGAMLRTLDQTYNMLELIDKSKPTTTDSPVARYYKQLLNLQERTAVEKAVEEVRDNLPDRLMQVMADVVHDLGFEQQELEKISKGYPYSREQVAAGVQLALALAEDQVQEWIIHKFDDDLLKQQYALTLMRFGGSEELSSVLSRALLPVQIDALEDFLAGIVRANLISDSALLGDLPPVPIAIIEMFQSSGNPQDYIRWAIDRRVTAFIESGPTEWETKLKEIGGVDVNAVGGDWGVIREAVARRDAYRRTSGIVDLSYLEETAASTERLGGNLLTDASYIESLLTELCVFGICVGLRSSSKFVRYPASTFPLVVQYVVDLERRGRWSGARKICESALDLTSSDDSVTLDILKINMWFCLQQLGLETPEIRNHIREFEPVEPRLEIGRLALLRDYRSLSALLRRTLVGSNAYAMKRYIRDMPLVIRAMEESGDIGVLLTDSGRPSKNRRRTNRASPR